MSFFKKKQKSSEPETVVAEDVKKSKNAKNAKNAKKNGMAQVLHESVAATVEEELVKNERFTCMVDGTPHYVCLRMDVSDIGGLDKKSRKVEAKGALIEAVNSGHLQAIITPELLEAEQLVFIPDSTTLFHMLDFGLLSENPETHEPIFYTLVYVNASGASNTITIEPVVPEKRVTFEDISTHIVDQEGHIEDILDLQSDMFDEEEDSYVGGEVDDFDEPDTVKEPEVFDDIPELEEEPMMDDAVSDDMDEIPPLSDDIDAIDDLDDMNGVQEEVPQAPAMDMNASQDSYQEPMDMYGQEEQENEIPSEWAKEVHVRKFYSDDLGLEVTTAPFDAQFLQNNEPVCFDDQRPSGWLNDQLNEMARQANQEMVRLHESNLFLMKKRYFNLISRHVERVQQELDINNPRTQYGMVKSKLDAARQQEMANAEALVSRQREDLEASWRRKLQEVGQDAARRAQSQYRERYGRQHELDIANLPDAVRSSIEDDYHDALHEIHDRRRVEAAKLLDLGITEVLDEVSDQYMSILADENMRYHELEENMRAFIEDNRSNDIARTNTLAEELRQKNKAQEVLEEQTDKIRRMRGEFDAERKKLLSDIDNLRADNKHHLEDLQAHSDAVLGREKERNQELERQLSELRVQNEKIYTKAREEYAHQLEEKNNEIAALHDRQREAAHQQKRTSHILIALVVAIAICAIGIGFIGGTYIRLNNDVKNAQTYQMQDYPVENTDTAE